MLLGCFGMFSGRCGWLCGAVAVYRIGLASSLPRGSVQWESSECCLRCWVCVVDSLDRCCSGANAGLWLEWSLWSYWGRISRIGLASSLPRGSVQWESSECCLRCWVCVVDSLDRCCSGANAGLWLEWSLWSYWGRISRIGLASSLPRGSVQWEPSANAKLPRGASFVV